MELVLSVLDVGRKSSERMFTVHVGTVSVGLLSTTNDAKTDVKEIYVTFESFIGHVCRSPPLALPGCATTCLESSERMLTVHVGTVSTDLHSTFSRQRSPARRRVLAATEQEVEAVRRAPGSAEPSASSCVCQLSRSSNRHQPRNPPRARPSLAGWHHSLTR